MSAARSSREQPDRGVPVAIARDLSRMRARRRRSRRRQRLARLDVAIGVLAAIVLLIATPGLAIVALVALLVLALCLGSFALEWIARARAARDPHEG